MKQAPLRATLKVWSILFGTKIEIVYNVSMQYNVKNYFNGVLFVELHLF